MSELVISRFRQKYCLAAALMAQSLGGGDESFRLAEERIRELLDQGGPFWRERMAGLPGGVVTPAE